MGEQVQDEPKSAIKHEGNYFIMDSEALVCNPFADLQSEVVSEAQKKASLTEKLTSVKNNVCDNHFNMKSATLERDKTHVLKQIHDSSSKLRYEVKLLDLDRQKHKIEVKKRVMPERDYSYEESQIGQTERRLGANIASFYLERRCKFPTRLKSVSDISTTPLVRKARQALKEQDVAGNTAASMTNINVAKSMERAHTAKTVSSSIRSASPGLPKRSSAHPQKINLGGSNNSNAFKFNRRNSRSAPLISRSYTMGAHLIPPGARGDAGDTRLPAIADAGPHKAATVKFLFEDPLKILTSKDKDPLEDSASTLSRAYTYHPGMGGGRDRLHSGFFLEGSDDEDDPYLPDHIDLRALLFDREGRRDEAVSMKSLGHTNHVPTPILRRSNMYAPKITQDLIQQENYQVQSKVDRFLQELHEHGNRQYDSDDDDDDLYNPLLHQRPKTSHVPPIRAKHSLDVTTDDSASQDTCAGRRQRLEQNKTPRLPKDAWRYIRGRSQDGALKGTYTPEDLVLQTLTGVPLSKSLTGGIPLNSAGRAMRHTATFKMRKVVERLAGERTKFMQHEIEAIKGKMEQGMDLYQAAAALAAGTSGAPGGLSRGASRMGPPGIMSRPETRMEPVRPLSVMQGTVNG